MLTRWRWRISQLSREIWVPVVGYAALGVGTAFLSIPVAPFVPDGLATAIGADAVDEVLSILASSMLAVTTFSLSIMVSAMAAASANATPRSTRLLREDRTAQNVLATFVGAFLFSVVGIVALHAGLYQAGGKPVLFVAAVVVIGLVVAALLRWIVHLTTFGRMADTLDRVETAAAEALAARVADPYLGGLRAEGPVPDHFTPVRAEIAGYVEHVDVAALETIAGTIGATLRVAALPGAFVHPGAPLVWRSGGMLDENQETELRTAFSIGLSRSFDQDPRFGLIVLTEIASRALSPAVNDPGTAIDVIGRLLRVLSLWTEPAEPVQRYRNVLVPPIRVSDLLEDAFLPIARDGAGLVEVQIRLQKALAALVMMAPDVFGPSAAGMAERALGHARTALSQTTEVHGIAALAGATIDAGAAHPRPAGV